MPRLAESCARTRLRVREGGQTREAFVVNAARAADIIRGGRVAGRESRDLAVSGAWSASTSVSRSRSKHLHVDARRRRVFAPAVTGPARVSRVKRRTAQESDIEAPAKKRFFLETTGRRRKKGSALRARVRGKRRHATRGGAVHQGNDVSYAVRTSHHDARDERRDARDALRRLEAPPMPGNVRGGAWRRAPRGRRRAAFSTRASRRAAMARSRRGRRAACVDTFQRRRPPFNPAVVRDRSLAPRPRRLDARARRPVGDRRRRGG